MIKSKSCRLESNNQIGMRCGGFSLIELLVVISIIGILVAIGLASYVNVQQKARDARRRSDIQDIAVAMEQQFSEDQEYPMDVTNNCVVSSYFSGGTPVDPKDGTDYHCQVDALQVKYCACALLEAGGGNAAPPSTSDCDFDTASVDFGMYYCQENKQ